MTKYTITHTIKADDVSIGLVQQVARAVANTLCPTMSGGFLLDLTEGYRLGVNVNALNVHEAARTAECMAGAIAPLVASVSVHGVVTA